MNFRWGIRCTACRWQAVVNALLPFAGQTVVEHPHQPIDGFWEDYICPEHYQIVRRTVRLTETMPDLVAAVEAYFEGAFVTTPIPTCPSCQQPMEGGQVLESLPFFLDDHLDAVTWLHQKLDYLRQTLTIERKAVIAGEVAADVVVRLLSTEATTILRFFAALQKELAIVEPTPMMDEYPVSLLEWEVLLDTQHQLTSRRIAQLQERQRKETAKIAGCCPQCHQKRVYLHRKETF
ncbi:MAG: hypothetical protein H6673_08800 [Anaerolineales bacterium]|nr:hypothetical protein [Anaerolineales bacterium]